jgi:hypothetical protein
MDLFAYLDFNSFVKSITNHGTVLDLPSRLHLSQQVSNLPSRRVHYFRPYIMSNLFQCKNTCENAGGQNTASIIPELPSKDAGRKMKACEKQQTEWMSRIDVIAGALPKTTSHALQDGWLKMPRKLVLTGNIVQALRRRFQQKSYLGHLSSTKTFIKSSKLANVSTALHQCLEFISKVTTSQAKQFETVSELINVYVYKALTDHLNSAHKKNMHESFEMALYWTYLKMDKIDDLRKRTIDLIRRMPKEAPANDHFLPLLWKGFAECQSKWALY